MAGSGPLAGRALHYSTGSHSPLLCAGKTRCAAGEEMGRVLEKQGASRCWPHPEDQPIWQTDCWDTQLRAGESYSAKWDYVRHNAVRHGLVEHDADWPYQGELNILDWHDT